MARKSATQVCKNKPTKKVKPPSYPTLPERMTDDEELALALVLWKSLRCHELLTRTGQFPTDESMSMEDVASKLARRCGVTKQYYDLVFRLRLVLVSLKPMET